MTRLYYFWDGDAPNGTVDCLGRVTGFSIILWFSDLVAVGIQVPVVTDFWGVHLRCLHGSVLIDFGCGHNRNCRFCHVFNQAISIPIKAKLV